MSASALRIASVYPELLGTYGDGGNVLVLERRLAWRDLPQEVVTVSLGDVLPTDCDLYVLGGGEDEAQLLALDALRRSGLVDAAGRGAHVFAVCAGMQVCGTWFRSPGGPQHEGLGLLDVTTERRAVRAVGDVVAAPAPALDLPMLIGFENHGGGSTLGPGAQSLAAVQQGVGNDGTGSEGATQGRVVSTYLHGPVLAQNPALADLLLTRALGSALPPLDDRPIEELRRQRLRRSR